MSQLLPGRIPMWPKEAEGVEKLLASLGLEAPPGPGLAELTPEQQAYIEKSISFTREGETLQVEIEGEIWRVSKAGKAKKA